jgi:hypothetical protein
MKKYLNTFILLFLVNIINIYSQSYQSSLIAEVAGLTTNTKDFYLNKDNAEFVSAFVVSYSGQIRLNPNYKFEFRSGYLFSSLKNDHFYSKIQFGLFLRRKLIDSTFCAFGVNSEINPMAEGTSTSASPKRFTFSLGGTIGLSLNKDFSILLSYYKTLTEEYGYSYSFITDHWSSLYKYLFWILKFGIELKI